MDAFQEVVLDQKKKVCRAVKNMRCTKCMKTWKENGKKPENMPQCYSFDDIKNNKCPVCGEEFQPYFPF